MQVVAPFSLCDEEQVEPAGSLSGEMGNDMRIPSNEEKPGSDGGSVVMQGNQECNKVKDLKKVWVEYLDFIKAFQ